MRAFLLIWSGQVVSLMGTAMTRFALLVWAWDETGSATALAMLLFFQIGAAVVVSPLAGVVVDRFDRRWVMVASDLGAGAATAVLLALLASGRLELWHIYAAGVVAGAAESFQFPAYSAAVTLLLPGRHYARASGLVSMAQSGSMILGPPLAGALLPFTGYVPILVADLVTVGVALATLAAVAIPAPPPAEAGEERGGIGREMASGFRYIGRRRGLLGLQLLLAAGNFLLVFGIALRAPLVLARTGGDQLALGQVMAAAGIGGALGGLALAAWGGPRRRVVGVLAGWMLSSAGNLVLGLGRGLAAWMAGAFLYPFFVTVTNGLNQAIWQVKVEPAFQGRVFAARRLIAQASLLPAMALAGPLADRVLEPAMAPGGALQPALGPLAGSGPGAGIGLLIAGTAVLAIVAVAAGSASRAVRHVERDLPDHAAVGGGGPD
jgi:MFS family permease